MCDSDPAPLQNIGKVRTAKYRNSIDDKMDDLHFYITLFIKFGIGRTTYDVSQEIRNDLRILMKAKNLSKNLMANFLADILKI